MLLGINEGHPCPSPKASLWLVKFVPDEFVAPLPPFYHLNYLGYKQAHATEKAWRKNNLPTVSAIAWRNCE
jgi:hypothetical protein